MNTVCGVIQNFNKREVRVFVDRKSACQGCQALEICHSFTKPRMELSLDRPKFEIHEGDQAVIALEESHFLLACTCAFMVPVIFILIALGITTSFGLGVTIQTVSIVAAFSLSLIPVKKIGNRIKRPRIIEVIHEEG